MNWINMVRVGTDGGRLWVR